MTVSLAIRAPRSTVSHVMARTCTVCTHAERHEMDELIVAGRESLRGIARRFSLSKDAVIRHRAKHLPRALVEAQEARRVANADDLLTELESLYRRASGWLDQAEAQGDIRGAAAVMRELRGTLELIARILGEIREQQLHLHTHDRIPSDVAIEINENLREMIRLYEEQKPMIEARMERHLLEGEAALPPAAIADVPRR